jgi:membrane fusion protein (multidrug efflux system)
VQSEVWGVVEEILVEEGDQVTAGQILARLDNDKLTQEVAAAEADMAKLKLDFERSKSLYSRKLVSLDEFDRANYLLLAQQARYKLANLRLQDAVIRAPISGIISERHIKTGNTLNVSDKVFRITQMDKLQAIVHIPDQEVSKLQAGQRASIHVDSYNGQAFMGHIVRISPVVDIATGTVRATIEMDNDSNLLRPGMFSRVSILYDQHADTLLIPRDAVLTEDEVESVFVIQDNVATRTPIHTGYADGQFIEILSGLEHNDVVVTTGQAMLKDKSKVEVIDTEPAEEQS